MSTSVRARVMRGVGAASMGPIGTMLIQVIAVPIYLHYWGARLYGEWLIISAVPIYLGLVDLGFGNVSGNDMTIRVAAGDRRGALKVYATTCLTTGALVSVVALTLSATLWFLPLNHWLNLSLIPARQTAAAMLLLSFYMLLSVVLGCLHAGFKCSGQYPAGIFWWHTGRLAENASAALAVMAGAGPVTVAGVFAAVRLAGVIVARIVLRRRSPWVQCDLREAQFSTVRHLIRPAIAFQAFPAGEGIRGQGTIILVGSMLGPVAVVVFSTMRTLTRFAVQFTEVIKLAVWPEVSAAFGAKDYALARKLHSYSCQAALFLSTAAATALYFFGPLVYRMWIHDKVAMDTRTFHWLLVVIVVNSLWNASSIIAIGSNSHTVIASVYLAGSIGCLFVAWFLMRYLGLAGAAIGLLTNDAITGWYVLRTSMRLVHDNFIGFGRSLISFPSGVFAQRRPPLAVGMSHDS